ncbi:MAG: site-2 protease family protein [Thermoanaerobaculia bacterium]
MSDPGSGIPEASDFRPPWVSVPALPVPRGERWWLHILLFGLTFATVSLVGMQYAPIVDPLVVEQGTLHRAQLLQLLGTGILTYTLPLLSILFCHEMGHYLACRFYGVDASPPYFLPFLPFVPLPGTFGAFIRIREPFRNRKQLFDIGVAGPLAGFIVAVPVLVYGILHTRPVVDLDVPEGTTVFGYPIAIRLLQKLLLHREFTSLDVHEHPAFMAGWFGLFVTALNLLPFGQLDGGHAVYALFGRHQRKLVLPLLLVLAGLGFSYPGWWVWVVIILILGTKHPPVLDDTVPLGAGRKLLSVFVFLIFLVSFTRRPISEYSRDSAPRRSPEKRRGTLVHQLDVHARAKNPG